MRGIHDDGAMRDIQRWGHKGHMKMGPQETHGDGAMGGTRRQDHEGHMKAGPLRHENGP
jgi:hypothetical protein